MNVIIEAPFSLSDKQRKDIENEVHTLKKYNDKISKAEVHFKKDDGNKVDAIVAELRLFVPGPDIFASASHNDYQSAFTSTVKKAESQLRKAKDIKTDHHN